MGSVCLVDPAWHLYHRRTMLMRCAGTLGAVLNAKPSMMAVVERCNAAFKSIETIDAASCPNTADFQRAPVLGQAASLRNRCELIHRCIFRPWAISFIIHVLESVIHEHDDSAVARQ